MLIPKLIRSFSYALAGIWHCICQERNFRIHICAAVVTALLAAYYKFTRAEAVLLALVVASVMIAELFNTALEAAVDLITDKPHPLAKLAKDVAAAAVLISAGCAVVCAVYLFGQPDVIVRLAGDIVSRPMAIVGVAALIVVCYLFIRGKGEKKHV